MGGGNQKNPPKFSPPFSTKKFWLFLLFCFLKKGLFPGTAQTGPQIWRGPEKKKVKKICLFWGFFSPKVFLFLKMIKKSLKKKMGWEKFFTGLNPKKNGKNLTNVFWFFFFLSHPKTELFGFPFSWFSILPPLTWGGFGFIFPPVYIGKKKIPTKKSKVFIFYFPPHFFFSPPIFPFLQGWNPHKNEKPGPA